jgi:hypothetical protein
LQFLKLLDPTTTQRIRPYGCIAKLESLEFWLTETILTLGMFLPVAELVCYERIACHMLLQYRFPRILATYEDVLSQMETLSERQKQEESRQEEVTR